MLKLIDLKIFGSSFPVWIAYRGVKIVSQLEKNSNPKSRLKHGFLDHKHFGVRKEGVESIKVKKTQLMSKGLRFGTVPPPFFPSSL